MVQLATVAACSLNQWALDFEGNLERIKKSIKQAKSKGARLRVGPELEICGYGCADHFLEADTYRHSWEVLGELLKDPELNDIIIETGMPVYYKNTRYNCRVLLLDGKILLIRPKLHLANSGNYRESRWFSCWHHRQQVETYLLPELIQNISGQDNVPIGEAIIKTLDTSIGCEVCEELFTADAPHVAMGLNGVEIFTNGSASHWEVGKLNTRIALICGATVRSGGVYLYANQLGTDGEGTLYYDGGALISLNGDLLSQVSMCHLEDVVVETARFSLDDIRVFRGLTQSLGNQGAATLKSFPQISIPFRLSQEAAPRIYADTPRLAPYISEVEDMGSATSAWLWDYLRKSGATGFFLPLSGGLDSAACALLVFELAGRLISEGQKSGEVEAQVMQVLKVDIHAYELPSELMGRLLFCAYMSMAHSSRETRERAETLASFIGASYISFPIDTVVSACVSIASVTLSFSPRFSAAGGTRGESLALQNLQARLRMVIAYFCAQLIPTVRHLEGPLLLLGTANVDEGLRGYFTKYDCSSGDLNPIGSWNKDDTRNFVCHMVRSHDFAVSPLLCSLITATPTAELEPGGMQTDEADMGMTYDELQTYGRLRSQYKAGPLTMLTKLSRTWQDLSLQTIADKVKAFFVAHASNRHKILTITPALHSHSYNIDNHRFDQRPFLYNRKWSWQFRKIDEELKREESLKK